MKCLLQQLPPGSSEVDGRLTFARATRALAGDYTCRAVNVDGSYEDYARLDVIPGARCYSAFLFGIQLYVHVLHKSISCAVSSIHHFKYVLFTVSINFYPQICFEKCSDRRLYLSQCAVHVFCTSFAFTDIHSFRCLNLTVGLFD